MARHDGLEKGLGRYTAVLERDENGHWLVHAKERPECHTHGRSIAQARSRLREALGLFYRDAARAELVDDVQLPRTLRTAVDEVARVRAAADQASSRAAHLSREVAKRLVGLGLSTRDAAALLHVSQQRVAQLTAE